MGFIGFVIGFLLAFFTYRYVSWLFCMLEGLCNFGGYLIWAIFLTFVLSRLLRV